MTALSNSKIYYIFGDSLTADFSSEYIFNVPPAKVRNAPCQFIALLSPYTT